MISIVMLVLSQAPVISGFDDGLIVGRVCEDLDGDGRCAEEEPGLAGAHVVLETGLTAVTDAQGRYHFAAVAARAPDASQGGRLLYGRHRLAVDDRWLPRDVRAPPAVNLELPMGGVVMQDFQVTRATPPVRPALEHEPPRLQLLGQRVRWEASVKVAASATLRVRGQRSEGPLALKLEGGENLFPFTTTEAGVVELWALPVDVVRRASSVLVVPRELRSLGRVVVDPSGEAHPALLEGATVIVTPGVVTGLVFTVGSQTWSETVERPRAQGVFALGLLDLEASFDPFKSAFHLAGRGAGTVRARLGEFDLGADLDLRDTDVEAVVAGQPVALLQARRVDAFDRQLDLGRVIAPTAGDDSATVASNPGEARLRVELGHDSWGKVGAGSTRFGLLDTEVGRAHRAVQGAFLDLHTPAHPTWGAALRGVVAGPQADVVTGLSRRPAHDRFESTGGSLFFLAHGAVVQGSELARIEWRDAVTGLAVRDIALTRLKDYSLDALSGRVLLARPLSFFAGQSLLTDPLSAGLTMVLVVDYEYLALDATGATVGGEASGTLGPVKLSAAGLHDGAFELLRGRAEATLGPVWLTAEVAHSAGAQEGLGSSRDGGLTFSLRGDAPAGAGWAGTFRARSRGLFGRGAWDLSARFRDPGFEDLGGVGQARQVSLRGEQPLGPVVVSVLADLRDVPDPRDPFSGARVVGHVLGGGVGYEQRRWGVRLEARELSQSLDGEEARGGLSVGLAGRFSVTPWLQLRAGYRHRLLEYGAGFDDTFAMLGADVSLAEWLTVGLRGGWGPATGPLAWGTVAGTRGAETWYGAHSLDVDAPGAGERRLVTGVRQQLSVDTAVFVEDVSATDVAGLRMARAVGLSQRVADGLTVTGRYEHGARSFDGVTADVARDAGGLTVAFESQRLRGFARGEARLEQGGVQQWLATGGGEVTLAPSVAASARVQFSHTSRASVLQLRALDAVAGLAWRPTFGAFIARYAFHREGQGVAEAWRHVVSLLPTVRLGNRFALGAGGHVGVLNTGLVLSASLRPSMRLIAGLELALEGGLRSSAPDGGSLTALRAEVGYRFDLRLYLGAGYSVLGYSGTGLEVGAVSSNNRFFLRAEVAY